MCPLIKHYMSAEAGIKKKLVESGSYPYGFGLAIAGLMRDLGPPVDSKTSLHLPEGEDDSGALDDFTKGRANTWWRKL